MRITKYGHSCLQVQDGSANVLIDPGSFRRRGSSTLTGLTAVLVTHQHADHADLDRLPGLLEATRMRTVYADVGSVAGARWPSGGLYGDRGAGRATSSTSASPSRCTGGTMPLVHDGIRLIPNAAYLVNGRLLHPGDSFTVPPVQMWSSRRSPWPAPVDGPSRRPSSTSARSRPRSPFPIHEGMLASTAMVHTLLTKLGPTDARWLDLDDGHTEDL